MTDEQREKLQNWVKALRSGGYEQGQNALKRGNAYCCLGVLCDLEAPTAGSWNVYTGTDEYRFIPVVDPDDYRTGSLPKNIQQDYGLSHKEQDHLILLNDDKEDSFDEIADYIEQNIIGGATK